MVRAAYILREDDDDWSQARALVRDVIDEPARKRLVANIVGHLCDSVSESVLQRAFDYWRNVDQELGNQVEAGVRDKLGGRSQSPGLASAEHVAQPQAAG